MASVGPFVNERLPEEIEQGAQGGPSFNTGIQPLDSGYEKRNINWALARAKYDISYGIQSMEELQEVINFFYVRRGRAVGFRFKDWTDYTFTDQIIATGTAGDTSSVFPIFKRYVSGAYFYDRPLSKLVAGTVKIYKNGALMTSGFSVDVNSGLVSIVGHLAENDQLSASGEFDVPVRFDTDELPVTAQLWNAGSVQSIALIELKDYESHFGLA